jgi:thioredoxin-like negative regulator of GroEL
MIRLLIALCLGGRNSLPTRVPASEVGLAADVAIVVFTEKSCHSCQDVVRLIRGPAGAGLPVADIEYGTSPELHRKFDIDTVPTTVIVDEQGTVVAGWVGRIDLSEFTTALAKVV